MYIGMIVAFILLIIFIMACIPLSYHASIHYENKLNIQCHALWIGKLFRFHFSYEENESLNREFYFLGKLRWGNAKDYQRWLAKKVKDALDEESPNNDSTSSITGKQGMPLSIDNDKVTIKEEEWLQRQIEDARKAQDPVTDEQNFEACATTCPTENENEKKEKPATNNKSEDNSKSKDISQKIANILDEIHNNEEEYSWILDKRIWSAFFTLITKLYNHSKPKYWELNGVIGLGDPAYTAMVAGVFYATLPANSGNLKFEYLEPVAKGHIGCKGRAYLPVILWHLTIFLWTKPVRKLILEKSRK